MRKASTWAQARQEGNVDRVAGVGARTDNSPIDGGAILHLSSIHGSFKGARILHNVSFSVRRRRIITLLKPSNSNGSALVGYIGLLRRISSNRV